MAQKPSIPKGTRDFSPIEMARRNYIFDTIKKVYRLYGFQQIETPAMENIESLTGKYGDEGDQLLFKILNSRPQDAKESKKAEMLDAFQTALQKNTNSSLITERALRYDLTVPFARYVVQHRNELSFPFKRYQIQPVWRADRPQKGRYREFYQCDADVIGSQSLINELELIQIIDQVFRALNINVAIKLNNRKLLSGIAEVIGQPDKIVDITVAIDKLDKIGLDKVKEELADKGITEESIVKLEPILNLNGTNSEKLAQIKEVLRESAVGQKGVEELETIFDLLTDYDLKNSLDLDLTLARGLNYYTGAILEVKALDVRIGSICGGGRYDDLTGIFGLPDVSGVGISFGADRIYDVLDSLNGFPEATLDSTQLLFANFGPEEQRHCLKLLSEIRGAGINAEIYPDSSKMKKQMAYANSKAIPYVALIGSQEITDGKINLKNMETGEQQQLSTKEVIAILSDKA